VTAGDLITADGQLEWRATLLGTGTAYGMTELEGWLSDLPPMRGSDFDRPSRHGMFPGASEMSKRTVTWSGLIACSDPTQLGGLRNALQVMTAPAEVPVEEPLVIRDIGGVAWMCMARAKRRTVSINAYTPLGYADYAIQWEATDPRLYSPALHTASTALASPPTTGLQFPLIFPLDFGAGPTGGNVTVTNAGSVATWPVFTIVGPVTGPVVTNHATGAQLLFSPTFTITAGQTLTIDTDQRQVTLNGVPANNLLFTRGWFPLLPGSTRIDFTSAGTYDPAALLTVRWRDAAA
jgi:hypothetical protein